MKWKCVLFLCRLMISRRILLSSEIL
jgi:hypothetical protein